MVSQKRPRAAFEAALQAHQSPYAFYGSPLPPLDPNVRDDGSYVPLWKQEVVDDRGRKRLHGAFKGGYSAGYFNTVGSKEGWTPSNFVSSRQNRQKPADGAQRPEDFMDEEDIAEAADSERLLTARSYHRLDADTDDQGSADPGNSSIDFFRLSTTANDSVGAKLLQKMGWRTGQGIGPKVRRRARLEDTDQSDESFSTAHLFAPEDSPMIRLVRKNDTKGLGHAGHISLAKRSATNREPEDDDEPFVITKRVKPSKRFAKLPSQKTGFTVGISNGSDSDEDPYSIGPRVSYNRTISSQKEPAKVVVKRPPVSSNPFLAKKPVFTPTSKPLSNRKSMTSRPLKCHDGKTPLKGFVLSIIRPSLGDEHLPVPQIPLGWVPKKPSEESSRQTPSTSSKESVRTTTLDPKLRANILGESQLPGKSVFDFLSPDARNHIASVSGRLDLPQGKGEAAPQGFQKATEQILKQRLDLIPPLTKDVATDALNRGWMPYPEDDQKRARYRAFLEFRGEVRKDPPIQPSTMSSSDWVKELEEFARAAIVFRPVGSSIGPRFVAASTQEGSNPNTTSLGTPLLRQAGLSPKNPADEAARLGMYGDMTRSLLSFHPTSLLCKRFGMKVPPVRTSKDHYTGVPTSNDTPQSRDAKSNQSHAAEVLLKNKQSDQNQSHIRNDMKEYEAQVDPTVNSAIEGSRPGKELFQSIFGSE